MPAPAISPADPAASEFRAALRREAASLRVRAAQMHNAARAHGANGFHAGLIGARLAGDAELLENVVDRAWARVFGARPAAQPAGQLEDAA
jgi:hypothetical protein